MASRPARCTACSNRLARVDPAGNGRDPLAVYQPFCYFVLSDSTLLSSFVGVCVATRRGGLTEQGLHGQTDPAETHILIEQGWKGGEIGPVRFPGAYRHEEGTCQIPDTRTREHRLARQGRQIRRPRRRRGPRSRTARGSSRPAATARPA